MKSLLRPVLLLSSLTVFASAASAEEYKCGGRSWHVKGPSMILTSKAECDELDRQSTGVNPWHHKKTSYVVGGGPASAVRPNPGDVAGVWMKHFTKTTRMVRVFPSKE